MSFHDSVFAGTVDGVISDGIEAGGMVCGKHVAARTKCALTARVAQSTMGVHRRYPVGVYYTPAGLRD